jgi:NADH:ubiquinone oxidoreductase subunit K
VRIYSTSSEEILRARNLLKDWVGEGYLTKPQYELLEKETVSELRTTNIFLRLVLFLFTLIIVGAAVALFFVVFRPTGAQTEGVFFLIFAAVCYAAAEIAVSQARLYRYGIEEALAVCSVAFLSVGMQAALFSGSPYSP